MTPCVDAMPNLGNSLSQILAQSLGFFDRKM